VTAESLIHVTPLGCGNLQNILGSLEKSVLQDWEKDDAHLHWKITMKKYGTVMRMTRIEPIARLYIHQRTSFMCELSRQ